MFALVYLQHIHVHTDGRENTRCNKIVSNDRSCNPTIIFIDYYVVGRFCCFRSDLGNKKNQNFLSFVDIFQDFRIRMQKSGEFLKNQDIWQPCGCHSGKLQAQKVTRFKQWDRTQQREISALWI